MLNRYDRSSPMNGEAEVRYLDGDFRVVRPGAYVRCAVTGVPIPLEELKYWSVEKQEAYASPQAVLERHGADYPAKAMSLSAAARPSPASAAFPVRPNPASPAIRARFRPAHAAPDRRSCGRDPFRW